MSKKMVFCSLYTASVLSEEEWREVQVKLIGSFKGSKKIGIVLISPSRGGVDEFLIGEDDE